MSLLKRISELVTANINHLLDQAEDPEVMVKQIIRDMEESIIELRRETVRALAHQKQIEKQIQAASGLLKDLESKAKLALKNKEDELARDIIVKKLHAEQKREALEKELPDARDTVAQLKTELSKLEDRVQEARRKKEELIRRKRAAQSKLRIHNTARKSTEILTAATGTISKFNASIKDLDSYEEAILDLEAESEAAEELLKAETQKEPDLDKYEKKQAIEKELERLKKEQK
jgi:phage shock protein A